jgi:hypothetical protein
MARVINATADVEPSTSPRKELQQFKQEQNHKTKIKNQKIKTIFLKLKKHSPRPLPCIYPRRAWMLLKALDLGGW